MKKLFLQDGKLMCCEFPENQNISWELGNMTALEYEAALSAAKASAVEVVNPEYLNESPVIEGQLYDLPEGWTVEIDNVTEEGVSVIRGSKYKKEGETELKDVRKVARLIPLKATAMTTDNSRYEEAAKEHSERNGLSMNIKSNAYNSFLAGASFAEKEAHNDALEVYKEMFRQAGEKNKSLQNQIEERDATIKQLQEDNQRLKEALNLQNEYINLLTEEIGSMLPIADTHGWRSTRHEAGKELRAKIENARKLIEP